MKAQKEIFSEIPIQEFPELTAKIVPCREQLIPVTRVCPSAVAGTIYKEQGIPGATSLCLLRETAARMLADASRLLPTGYSFYIYDAWRPLKVQIGLYEAYYAEMRREHPEASDAEIARLTALFVSLPSRVLDQAPVHTTGGAVDLTITDDSGQFLDMGTEFDSFGESAHTAYFEGKRDLSQEERIVKNNRRLLYHVMTQVGFTNLPTEWWHYDYGDSFWAYYMGQDAIYNGIME